MIAWIAGAVLAGEPAPALLVARGTFAVPSPHVSGGVSWWAWRSFAIGVQGRRVRSSYDTERSCKVGGLDCVVTDRDWRLDTGLATMSWSVPGRSGYLFQWFTWNLTASADVGSGGFSKVVTETSFFNLVLEDESSNAGIGPVVGLELTGAFGLAPAFGGFTVGWTTLPGVLTTVTVGVTADLILARSR